VAQGTLRALLALCLLSSCLTDEEQPETCGTAPVYPGVALSTPGNGTVVLSLDQWSMLTMWMDETRAWTTCIESR